MPFSVLYALNLMALSNVMILLLASTLSIWGMLTKNNHMHLMHLKKISQVIAIHGLQGNLRYFSQKVSEVCEQLDMPMPDICISPRENNMPQISLHCISYPNYTIIISLDLLKRLKHILDEQQLNFLIAHEFGHFSHRDHAATLYLMVCQGSFLLQSLITMGCILSLGYYYLVLGTVAMTAGFIVQLLLVRWHSRSCEFTADDFAFEFCQYDLELPAIFDHISNEYRYWGIARYQNAHAEFKAYSDENIAPLLKRLYRLEKKNTQHKNKQDQIFSIRKNLLQLYPFNQKTEEVSSCDILTWFNSQPTSRERAANLGAKL